MGTADKIRELIEQTATIKANFHLENSLSFSSYDWRKREKKINYMQVEKINDDPEFGIHSLKHNYRHHDKQT